MKRFILFARLFTSFIFTLPIGGAAQVVVEHFPNYVVIGAFAHHKNAVTFTRDANQARFPAQFEMNPNRNLYYVYVLATDDREFAIAEAVKLRAETKYFDTWVYCGALGDMVLANPGNAQHQDLNPLTGKGLESVRSDIAVEDASLAPDRQGRSHVPNASTLESSVPPGRNNVDPHIAADGSLAAADRNSMSSGIKSAGSLDARSSDRSRSDIIAEGSPVTPGDDRAVSIIDTETADVAQGRNQLPSMQAGAGNDQLDAGRKADHAENLSAGRPGGWDGNTSSRAQAGEEKRTGGGDSNDEVLASRSQGDRGESGDVKAVEGPPPVRASVEPLRAEDVVGKNFYFHLFRADNGKMIAGEVDAIDFEKSRKMATYPGNEEVTVRMPSGKSKQVSLLCQVFGYRKQQREFVPDNPEEDFYLDDKGNVVVPFELVRLQKGDIAIMYNVFFFKDAAVMRPESRYEVNNLLELLNENPSYNIRIHGHTNGNASGKIIRMGTPGNFYSLAGTKQGAGSAKKLSEERAIVIREFLISSGIGPERMEVKAWGGKKPIHDKHSARAHENVRVEIEILSK